jgi:SPP1 gp7 family putative phage head morphogenesis protein
MSEGIDKGETIDQIADRVTAVQKEAYVGQARTVARTETMSVFSKARVDAMQTAGVTKHEWLSARDEATRDTHQIDGEVVIIGEPFSNGLLWPLEWGADASEVINCRCVALPVVED